MKSTQNLLFALILTCAAPALAYTWSSSGTVTTVEATYMPGTVQFAFSGAGSSTCPTGSWMLWPAQGATATDKNENARAVFAGLMAALNSGRPIMIFATGCNVEFIHFLQ